MADNDDRPDDADLPWLTEDDSYDHDDDDPWETFDCHMDRDGYCGKAGSEECEFECPYRDLEDE